MSFVAGSREPMLTLVDAAARTGLTVKMLRTAIANGHLQARQPAGQRKLYVLVEDLDTWATAAHVPRDPEQASRVKQLRPRDQRPGSVARLEEIERRSVAT